MKQMIQMPLTRRRIVATNRADEMVLAGSAPTAAQGGDPIAHIHRGTSFIVLVDGAIVMFLIASEMAALGYLGSAGGTAFVGTGIFLSLMIYGGYRNRKPWAYWPAVVILFLASLLFASFAFLYVLQAVLGGIFSGLLFAFLMGWAALGSGRRALFHWHPGYRMGYLRLNPMDTFALQDGEMLAGGRSCLAVLAIQPTMLGRADRCPHCSAPLVGEDLINKYSDEEA